MSRSDPSLLRELNCGIVLSALRGGPPRRLADLAARTGLSRPTVGFAVDQLVEAGWVEYLDHDAEQPNTRGRPARLARFRSRAGHVLGIDLGPHKVTAAAADLDGVRVASHRRTIRDPANTTKLLNDISRTVDAVLADAELAHDDVLSVAVGAPGIAHAGILIQAPSLPGWTSLSVSMELGRSFNCPVYAHNDANLAALAERWQGVAAGAETVVFVQWGERLGTGILIGDRLHRGAHGAAGEIGYVTTEGDAAEPDEEGLGPLERAVSPSALVRLADAPAGGRGGKRRREAPPDAAAVISAAEHGDATAQRAIDTIAGRFAHGLAPLVLTLDPDIIVLGGGLSLAGQTLLGAVRQQLTPLTLAPCRLELSTLGDQAVLTGAIRLALSDVEERLLPTAPFGDGGEPPPE